MSARPLFDDDELLFEEPATSDRASHVEIRVEGERRYDESRETQPTIAPAPDYFARVPRVALKPRELALLPLSHREGFLLAMIDGCTSIETILDVCAMHAEEALELMESLVQRGVVVIPR